MSFGYILFSIICTVFLESKIYELGFPHQYVGCILCTFHVSRIIDMCSAITFLVFLLILKCIKEKLSTLVLIYVLGILTWDLRFSQMWMWTVLSFWDMIPCSLVEDYHHFGAPTASVCHIPWLHGNPSQKTDFQT
jgi:hypothetical protein